MANKHSYNSRTIKSLYAHSGNKCAFPECEQELLCDENVNISEICHIYGLNRSSARFVEGLNKEFLNSEQNLILLCPTHHAIIDAKNEESRFTAKMLIMMKRQHERNVKEKLNDTIKYNINEYTGDYVDIQRILNNTYGIVCCIDQVEKIGGLFANQKKDIRLVMRKILDVMHRTEEYKRYRECKLLNMMEVVNEMSGDYNILVQVIKYLEKCHFIEEQCYTSDNINSYFIGEECDLVDVSDDYFYKIQNGKWKVTNNGMILDAIYCEQGYL